jgi:outer membrane murein-binding lipoprotein Lpp
MVKQASKMAVVLLSVGLMTGCASKSDLNKLQGQVDDLRGQVAATKNTADQALAVANDANANAKRAATAAEAANGKLDRMFQKSMQK